MKRFWFLFLILAIVALISASVAFLSLDPDVFRPRLESYLSKSLHNEVQLGTISIQWRNGLPTLSCREFTLKNPVTGEELIKAGSIWGSFQVRALFRREMIIEDFRIEDAQIKVVRNEKGVWNWVSNPSERPNQSAWDSSMGWNIRVASVYFPKASLYYADRSQVPYYHAQWRALDIELTPSELSSYLIKLKSPKEENAVITALSLLFQGKETLSVKATFGQQGTGKLEIARPFQEARFNLKLELRKADLKRFPFFSDFFDGIANFSLEGSGEGLHPEAIRRTILLKGQTEIQNGAWYGHNLVNEILQAMAPVPGFVKLTREPFAGDFYYFSKSANTSFKNLRFAFGIEKGYFFFQDLVMQDPFYRIEGDGEMNISNPEFDFKGTCFFLDRFAAHLMSRVHDIDVLLNREKELEVPFSMKGPASESQPAPNLFYIANRLIQIRGEELASRGIQKINDFLEANRS